MTTLTVKKAGPVLRGHPWVFSGALEQIPEELESGAPVKLVDDKGAFLAQGYFNSYSQIAVRIWGYEEEQIDAAFFEKRIRDAVALRQYLSGNTNAYRLVNSENDWLPGLVVDKYADYLSVQFHTRGIDAWKEQIVAALVNVVHPKGIYERSESRSRKIEKTEAVAGLLYGEVAQEVEIVENGIKYVVDVISGQKTGFFLDQRDKRAALQKYVAGKRVLNCFSYTGGFSLAAAVTGAQSVVSVDASRPALETAEKNFQLNGLGDSELVLADVKEYLADLEVGAFDVIILDPPAFVKDRRKVREGLRGYRSINEQALKLLPKEGILLTCSCSAHISAEDFRFMLSEAAQRAGRTVQIIETLTHGVDHPVLPAFTEGEYLKCFFVRVLR